VVNRLGRIGSQCVIPYRGDGMNTRHLKVMGDMGQMVFLPIDMTDEDSIRYAVRNSNVVINLIGSNKETNNYSYHDVNVKVTHRIAKICAEAGNVQRFIHVSAAGADANAKSTFLRTKFEGEEVVKGYFPEATIIRPCGVYGDEDKFFNNIANMLNFFPMVPLVGDGDQKMQPIYVQDVAQGIVNAMVNSDAPGKTYTLGGPTVRTKAEIVDFITKGIIRPESSAVQLPEPVVRLFAKATQYLPHNWRLMSPDDVDQLEDDLTVPKNALTCADLGLTPSSMEKEGGTMFPFHRGSRDGSRGQFGEDELPKRYGRIESF
jgi:NADH dehydrogenase (ubiquinone) 1 alpha subcomplex subunit 9